MNKPYIICHMMTSVDGRIDCAMTTELPGDEYYSTLDSLNVPSVLSGRVTAQMEISFPGVFESKTNNAYGKEGFSKKADADGYEIITDTNGTLLWDGINDSDRPLLIVTSEKVTTEYLNYLDGLNISWIACGKDRINLNRVCEILSDEFGVQRMAVVGGGHINAAFLDAGLLDEVSILIGSGIDGRGGMTAVFDGLPTERHVFQLSAPQVQTYDSGAVWLRYKVKK